MPARSGAWRSATLCARASSTCALSSARFRASAGHGGPASLTRRRLPASIPATSRRTTDGSCGPSRPLSPPWRAPRRCRMRWSGRSAAGATRTPWQRSRGRSRALCGARQPSRDVRAEPARVAGNRCGPPRRSRPTRCATRSRGREEALPGRASYCAVTRMRCQPVDPSGAIGARSSVCIVPCLSNARTAM